MNRFTIDEDSGHEIVKIYEVEGLRRNSPIFEEQIGMGHIINFFNFWNISLFTLSSIALNLSYDPKYPPHSKISLKIGTLSES